MEFPIGMRDERIRLSSLSDSTNVLWGVVKSVDPESQKMTVEITSGIQRNKVTVPINNMFTDSGIGIRLMPLANATKALLYKETGDVYYHIGYYLENVKAFTDDKNGEKQESSVAILQRYLEEGEVQMLGLMGNEVLLANDGSVLVKSQNGAYLKLDNYSSTLEGSFASTRLELDDVTLRGGTMRRSTSETTEDENIYIVDDQVKKEQDITETDEKVSMKEFTVQVGIDMGDPEAEPTVGTISLADRMVDNSGSEVAMSGLGVQFKVQMDSGGGIGIGEDGSFYIMDKRGGDATRFEGGGPTAGDKTFRVGNNYITINNDVGVEIASAGGSTIEVKSDGYITIKNKDGRFIEMTQQGILLSFTKATISLMAKDLNFVANTCNFGMMPVDSLLAAKLFAAVYDLHTHAGPCGPVVIPITPLVLSGALTVAGVNVSI